MTAAEILNERRAVYGDAWSLPRSNPELKNYLDFQSSRFFVDEEEPAAAGSTLPPPAPLLPHHKHNHNHKHKHKPKPPPPRSKMAALSSTIPPASPNLQLRV